MRVAGTVACRPARAHGAGPRLHLPPGPAGAGLPPLARPGQITGMDLLLCQKHPQSSLNTMDSEAVFLGILDAWRGAGGGRPGERCWGPAALPWSEGQPRRCCGLRGVRDGFLPRVLSPWSHGLAGRTHVSQPRLSGPLKGRWRRRREGVVRSTVPSTGCPAQSGVCFGAHHLGLQTQGLRAPPELLVRESGYALGALLLSWGPLPLWHPGCGTLALSTLAFGAQPVGPCLLPGCCLSHFLFCSPL